MSSTVLLLHNLLRWAVVLAGAWAVFRSWRGWMSRGVWTPADLTAGKAFVHAMSLQFVVGIVLYAVSPLVRGGWADPGAGMRTSSVRYFMVEHVLMMVISVALTHVGMARVRKAASDSSKFQTATIWWGIALASVLGFIPWNRPWWPL